MFKRFKTGDRLVLQMNNHDVLVGDCKKCAENRVDMKNITNQEGTKFPGHMSFYTNEIVSVRLLDKTNEQEDAVLTEVNNSSTKNGSDRLLLPEEEFERLKKLWKNYIFIHQKDKLYYDAYDDLMVAESIGVVGLGNVSGRNSRFSLLVLSTWQTVYIFDISQCKERTLYGELKEILESGYIRKVVHDGRSFVDCMYHSYKVHVNNIFDTLISDIMIKKRTNANYDGKLLNVLECLTQCFNFPEYLIYGAVNVSSREWNRRPVEYEYKLKAAQLGAYLLTLKDHYMAKLLEDYNNTVKSVYRSYTNLDDFDFSQKLNDITSELANLVPGPKKNQS